MKSWWKPPLWQNPLLGDAEPLSAGGRSDAVATNANATSDAPQEFVFANVDDQVSIHKSCELCGVKPQLLHVLWSQITQTT